ncbi:MAG: hypothetical protein J0M25_14170 [Flavobacteriales bacterium]|nr:hypothetical protein [Flavobacteriales bacterium]
MQLIKLRRITAVCKNGGFSAFLETFVLIESSGIFSNFGAENPPLLQAAKRQAVKKPTFLQNFILYNLICFVLSQVIFWCVLICSKANLS